MTPREEELLKYITEFLKVNGYAPSNREMADALNTKSMNHIHTMLEHLKEKGFIDYEVKIARTIRVKKFH